MHRHIGCGLVGSALALAALGCADGAAPLRGPTIDSLEISVAGLPDEFDSLRTFRYRLASVRADSVLQALLTAGVDVRFAWRPLDNLCAGPIGPRFTVELSASDDRTLAYDFERGAGWLWCATRLMRYEVRPPG